MATTMTHLPMELQRVIYGHKFRMECEEEWEYITENLWKYLDECYESYLMDEDHEEYTRRCEVGLACFRKGNYPLPCDWSWYDGLEDEKYNFIMENYADEVEETIESCRL